MKRILGIDYGEKRVGVAISDAELRIALALRTIHHHDVKTAAREVTKIIEQDDISTVVVGLPLTLSGHRGERVERTRRFTQILASLAQGVNIVEFDERLSSKLAEKLISSGDIDQKSAVLILQDYLDRKQSAIF